MSRKMSLQHARKINHGRYAVLVIDMLNDFVYGKLRCKQAEGLIPKIQSLLVAAKESDTPVFFCNDVHQKRDSYEFRLWGKHALKGTWGAKIISDLKPSRLDHVVPKRTYSAFYNTKLDALFKKRFGKEGPDGVIISGIHTNICAKHTAFDAFVRGFDVMVAKDGVTAFTEKDHKYGLEYMKKNYGAKVIKTSEIIQFLKGT